MIMLKQSPRAIALGLTSLLLISCQEQTEKENQQVESELTALREDVLLVDKLPRPQRLYEERCAICHGDANFHPATHLLAKRYGPGKGGIVGRDDLTPEAVKAVVRNGQLEMYPFPKVDLSDEDLNEIANYVAGGAKK
ncbi:Cytochrome C oxidase, cbb3-type, subunit III [Sphingobium faniae]|nr:Cytochrome C oxidase, cbb3-type, subunit III [Sphingobium faniae]